MELFSNSTVKMDVTELAFELVLALRAKIKSVLNRLYRFYGDL